MDWVEQLNEVDTENVEPLSNVSMSNLPLRKDEENNEDKSKDEIFDYFVGVYGERILAIPVASGFNLMVWIAPIFVLCFGTFILINYLKVKNKPKQKVKNSDEKIPYNDLIEKELKALE